MDGRFLIITGSSLLLQKEDLKVSSPSLWGKGASLPDLTVKCASPSLAQCGRLWGSSCRASLSCFQKEELVSFCTYLGRQPEGPRKPVQRHCHNRARGILLFCSPLSCLQRAEFPGPVPGSSSGAPGGNCKEQGAKGTGGWPSSLPKFGRERSWISC